MKYTVISTKHYRKDFKRSMKSDLDRRKLEAVIDQLASGEVLSDRYRDHALRGSFAGIRECHIGPDWLLLYAKDHEKLILLLIRTGTHRDVLGIE